MKRTIAAITVLLLFLPGSVLAGPENEEYYSTLRSHLRKTQVANANAASSSMPFLMSPAVNRAKGSIQARGQFGKIDVSSVTAAQAVAAFINGGCQTSEVFRRDRPPRFSETSEV